MAAADAPVVAAASKPVANDAGKSGATDASAVATVTKPAAPAVATVTKPAAPGKGKGDVPPGTRPPPVPYRQLFRYATSLDMALNGFAFVCAVFAGAVFPCFALLFGDLLAAINSGPLPGGAIPPGGADPWGTFEAAVNLAALRMTLLGIGMFFAVYALNALPMYTSERQLAVVRRKYFAALLRQDAAYYDTHRTGEAATRMAEETLAVQEGMGEKVAQAAQYGSTFVSGIVIAFTQSWKMTLVMCAFLPLLAGLGMLMKNVFSNLEGGQQDAYARAGEVVSEALALFRTVTAFGGQAAEVKRYDTHLVVAERKNLSKALSTGLTVGCMMFVMFSLYGVSMYFGSTLIIESRNANPECVINPTLSYCFSGGTVMQVLFSALIGAMSLGQAAPNLSVIGAAQGAAAKIFEVIDRNPPIDVADEGGLKPDPATVRGRIEFRDVTFAYPTRPDQPVLRNFSLVIEPGTTVALCGPSGSGKSTIMGLLLRFYDPQAGSVLLDGIDIKEYNVRWLRGLSAVVQQEPVLFAASIHENIAMGRIGAAGFVEAGADATAVAVAGSGGAKKAAANDPGTTMFSHFPHTLAAAATREEVEAAAASANAAGFIARLSAGYDTNVTSAQLSGGEKQRVAIARAIIRNPRILLLDEATSALDTQSERVVQAALDRLLSGGGSAEGGRASRTAIVIAHRLSTVTGSDRIVVLDGGTVVEDGTHESLLAATAATAGDVSPPADGEAPARPPVKSTGLYANMWALQRLGERSGTHHHGHGGVGGTKRDLARASVTSATLGPSLPSTNSLAGSELAPDATPAAHSSTPPPAADGSSGAHVSVKVDAAVTAPAGGSKTAAVDGDKKGDAKKKGKGGKDAAASAPAAPPDPELAEKLALPPVPYKRVMAFSKPEMPALALGTAFACANGAVFPAFSILLSRMVAILFEANNNTVHTQALFYMGMFFLLAGGCFLLNVAQIGTFGWASGRFVRRIRRATFAALLRQEVGFFDLPENSPGKIASRLSQDAVLLSRANGSALAMTVQSMASLVAGLIIAFVASWRLTLLILACSPLMAMSGAAEMKAMTGFTNEVTKAFQQAAHVATEAMAASRTVAAYNLQPLLAAQFEAALAVPTAAGLRRARVAGIGQGANQFFMLTMYALNFWAGAQFIKNGWLDFQGLMQSFFAVSMAAIGMGHSSAFAVDAAKADAAKRSLFAIIDRQSAIDPSEGAPGAQLPPGGVTGRLELRGVQFTYPARPDAPVLKGINLTIEPGTTVALVGPSGCGKSSIIQQLLRFYDPGLPPAVAAARRKSTPLVVPGDGANGTPPAADGDVETGGAAAPSEPDGGAILLDGVDIRSLHPAAYRSIVSWVQQEAPLFADSVAYNIGYGTAAADKPEPDAGVPRDAGSDAPIPPSFVMPPGVEDAARSANAAGFIESFKHGFATFAGERGSQLSGGQKQRVAIARAVIRQPRILLLDEATSALDSESERVVSETIEALIRAGKAGPHPVTVVLIAHRLSTVKHADKIVVIDGGRVVDAGTHDELLGRPDGLYRRLALAQDAHAADHLEGGGGDEGTAAETKAE